MEQTLVLGHPALVWRRAVAVVLGAALVAAAAQVAVPLPGTPVPMTLQPLAVLIVGGLLGPWLGASSLVLYLALGAAGLPGVHPDRAAGRAAPHRADGRLPAGLSARGVCRGAAVGRRQQHRADRAGGARRARSSCILGGLAQLLLLTGSIRTAARFGTLPFLVPDRDQARGGGAGPAPDDSPGPRAPLMARVSFPARLREIGVALLWLALFAVRGARRRPSC